MFKKLMWFSGVIVFITNAIITFGDGAWLLGIIDIACAIWLPKE